MKPIPYENATSGTKARDEIIKLLRAFGCDSIGFMDEFETKSVLLAFQHRGRPIQLRASAAGWAALYLRTHPWNHRRSGNRQAYEAKALAQGQIAVNSILRDWVKGQVMAIETGILSFDAVFMPHMLANDGRPLFEHMSKLPMLEGPK